MKEYRKIQMSGFTIFSDSFGDLLVGGYFPDEVNLLNDMSSFGWDLVTIVDNHTTFIFSKTK